jgi:hypothetical protein
MSYRAPTIRNQELVFELVKDHFRSQHLDALWTVSRDKDGDTVIKPQPDSAGIVTPDGLPHATGAFVMAAKDKGPLCYDPDVEGYAGYAAHNCKPTPAQPSAMAFTFDRTETSQRLFVPFADEGTLAALLGQYFKPKSEEEFITLLHLNAERAAAKKRKRSLEEEHLRAQQVERDAIAAFMQTNETALEALRLRMENTQLLGNGMWSLKLAVSQRLNL